MTQVDRFAQLSERLAKSRFAANSEHVMNVVRGKEPLFAGMAVEVERAVAGKRAPNGESYHVKIKASTEAIARDQGIIPMSAWSNGGLRNFADNPIILAFHDHKQPIGRSVHTELDNNSMVQYWEFHGESEVSRMMQKLYEKGFMRAASVGFLVHEFTFIDELSDKELENLVAKYGAAAVRDIYWIANRAELLETSAVPVPSDPNALTFDFAARSAEAIGLDVSSLRNLTNPKGETMPEKPDAAAEAARAAEAAAAAGTSAAAVQEASAVEKGLAAITESLKSLAEGLNSLRALVEKSVVPAPAVGTSATAEGAAGSTEQRNDGKVETTIEKNDGETDEQAVERYVVETVAKLRGAPSPTKK